MADLVPEEGGPVKGEVVDCWGGEGGGSGGGGEGLDVGVEDAAGEVLDLFACV